MTDKEIIKALEYCVGEEYTCENCPFQEIKHYDYENEMFEIMPNGKQYDDWSCERWLNVAVLDLINRQQAEIDDLTERLDATIAGQETLQKALAEKDREVEHLNKEVDRLSQCVLYHDGHSEDAKSEAVKEFAERLKENKFTHRNFGQLVYVEDIDNLVKEMVGDNSNE